LKNLKNRFCSPRGTEKKVKEHPESDITFGGAWLRVFLNKENHRLSLWFQKSYTFAEKEETSDVKL